MKVIRIGIPIRPLSVNAAFQGRRFKTKKCKQYERDVFLYLPNKTEIRGYVSIHYEFHLRYFKITDVDNLIKVLQDCIVKKGIIEDDRKIVSLHIYKYPAEEDSIEVFIKEDTEVEQWFTKGRS